MRVGAPYVVGGITSRSAAASIVPYLGKLQRRIYKLIRAAGKNGMTCDEIEALGYRGNTVRPRLVELEERGLIRKTKGTRATRTGRQAVVWSSCRHINPKTPALRCPHCGQPMPRRRAA